jgi:hypothetical protein
MHTPSENRQMGMALVIGGCHLIKRCNNQLESNSQDNVDVEEVMQGGWSAWGNTVPSFWTSNGATQQ